MIKARMIRFLLILLAIGFALSARADGNSAVAVIVNRDNPIARLSDDEIRKIYTNSVLSWPDGAHINIYDLAIQDPLRSVFSERVLGRSSEQVADEWAHLKITNQAKNPPTMMKSEMLIMRRISKEKGAIGYVSLNVVKDNPMVKVIMVIQ